MFKICFITITFILVSCTVRSIETVNMGAMPLAFTENHGQWDDQVLFRANAGGATLWFTENGAYYQFTRRIPKNPVGQNPRGSDILPADPIMNVSDSIETMMIKASFVGANPAPCMFGEEILEYKCNYFIGNDPEKWRTDVPNYKAIVYEEIYAGIDMKYYGNGKQMEYDFIVSPGADPGQICVRYDGAKSLSVNESGELVVETEWGTVTELKPLVYQVEDNERTTIKGEYVLFTDNTFGFLLSEGYNPELALVIDPVLSYSTYLGGSSVDIANDIVIDNSGRAYIVGYTSSSNFPINNPFDNSSNGNNDIFVSKLSSTGNNLIYSTYLGGSSDDKGAGIAIDNICCTYLTGYTYSTNFPMQNPYDDTYNGDGAGCGDAFVIKLSADGNSIIYSTYIGGSSGEFGRGIAVNSEGYAYITGEVQSHDFPTTLNAYDEDYNGGIGDAFITKLSVDGTSLIYSTYLGGNNWDQGEEIALDASGCVYVTGYVASLDFPSINPYDSSYNGGGDVFLSKLSAAGDYLIYSTFLGGSSQEWGLGIAVDKLSCAYITGYTFSTQFPTENPYDGIYNGGGDIFISKFTPDGNNLVYSTYLGESGMDHAFGISIDESFCAYVTGYTKSPNFPILNPFDDGTYNGGIEDVFVTKLSTTGNSLEYSTFLGGNHIDDGWSIAVDNSGSAYITGRTWSSDFAITDNAVDGSHNGGYDAFVTKICGDNSEVAGVVSSASVGLLGVPVDLYDADNIVVSSAVTDELGEYQFTSLVDGDYTVSISTPLGYQADEETKEVSIPCGPASANFELIELEIIPQQRSRGYWKHQVSHVIKNIEDGDDKPTDYSAEDFMEFLLLTQSHFVLNQINPVTIYDGSSAENMLDSLKLLKELLCAKKYNDEDIPKKLRKGKAELMALILNVVSGKISQTEVISEDGANVSQAITYSWMLLNDEITCTDEEGEADEDADEDECNCNYKIAEKILKKINHGKMVKANVIPLDIQFIAYKQGLTPYSFSLYQNYPNPFNPVTEISFSLPEAVGVKLEIYNVTGQKVSTLINTNLEVGNHTLTWDASNFASGIYLYKLEAGDFVETRKMILLK